MGGDAGRGRGVPRDPECLGHRQQVRFVEPADVTGRGDRYPHRQERDQQEGRVEGQVESEGAVAAVEARGDGQPHDE